MTDGTGGVHPHTMRIDERILKHLLSEAVDMLEESQTHALIERSSPTTTHVLSQATWQLTTTCTWILGELTTAGTDAAARLKAPAPIFARKTEPLSEQLEAFAARVARLHQRACKLEELSCGPLVTTEPRIESSHTRDASSHSATIIQIFGEGEIKPQQENPIQKSQLRLAWALTQR